MKHWKKLIGITGAILLSYVLVTAAFAPSDTVTRSLLTQAVIPDEKAAYTARDEEDKIVIYAGDAPMLRTDTRVSQLPKIDRIRLREGVELFSEKELKEFVEDYCS